MSLRHAVLGLLAAQPASGYDLLKTFQSSLANVWPATQSQLYGELARLADSGLVEVRTEGPRGRKEYEITDAGRRELRHWILEVEPERVRRSDTLLRAFLLGSVEPEHALDFLQGRATAADERHAELRALAASTPWGQGDLSVYGRITLEWGLRFSAMQREWADWAAGQIAAASPAVQQKPR
ncbi:PadR family transcriptional regulator [Streptomyces boluensis]|uniref:PadR family transcriptional regulator n=1 Tax=Streptomyces boluensis TaxID=1775135 RepID=A0A964UMB8_9ACTN|nr:PadR family transcriptional regulator [Streptomyces boluensis]NBE50383.1 PadR family transcriptional regulator [Streptomyces boluensis]